MRRQVDILVARKVVRSISVEIEPGSLDSDAIALAVRLALQTGAFDNVPLSHVSFSVRSAPED